MVGLYSKKLSHDPATGARTALQCIDPARGYAPPDRAHYHHMDEELFVLKGDMSFDSKNWLGRMAYCFHPAETVHGFKSAVRSESWFISRVSKELDFCFCDHDTGEHAKPFSLAKTGPERAVCVLADARQGEWQDVRDASGKVTLSRRLLSRHPKTGEGSMLVRFAPGWVSPHESHFHSVYEEAFVLEGAIELADGSTFGAGCYTFKPPGTLQARIRSPEGALVFINFGGPMDFRPASDLKAFRAATRH
jgi:quercetin dioxygenase-like cupin family protein